MRTAIESQVSDVERLNGSCHRREFGWSIKLAPPKQRKQKCETACSVTSETLSTAIEIRQYSDLILVLRTRADELQLSRETIDAIAGLPERYASKVLSLRGVRRIGMQTLGPLLAALGMKLIAVEDEAAMKRNQSQYVKRDDPHTRSAKARHSRPAA